MKIQYKNAAVKAQNESKKTQTQTTEGTDYESLSSPIEGVSTAKSLYLMDILKTHNVL